MQLHKTVRPREKMQRSGPASLREEELLAILLGTGTPGKDVLALSREILKNYPDQKLLKISLNELRSRKGIGIAKACVLLAAFELTQRLLTQGDDQGTSIQRPKDALVYVQEIRSRKKEHFIVLYLNARNQVIYKEFVSIGTLNSSLVHPREVFAPALQHSAAGIVLAHNHPSGNCSPSSEDLELTQQLKSAGELLGIEVLDHLVVSETNYMSMKEKNLI